MEPVENWRALTQAVSVRRFLGKFITLTDDPWGCPCIEPKLPRKIVSGRSSCPVGITHGSARSFTQFQIADGLFRWYRSSLPPKLYPPIPKSLDFNTPCIKMYKVIWQSNDASEYVEIRRVVLETDC